MRAVTLVDTGASNLHSVRRALEAVGARVEQASTPAAILQGDRVVLPGVGAFASGMKSLRERGLDDALREVARAGRPLFGICLGMQLLFERGTEGGEHAGLGLLTGTVSALPPGPTIPHMGWHRLEVVRPNTLVAMPATMYFAHSYFVPGDHPAAVATVTHGTSIAAAVLQGAIAGCQFHPEKSSRSGLDLLRAWLEAA